MLKVIDSTSVDSFKIAGRTIGDRIAEGISEGLLVQRVDGRYQLSEDGVREDLLTSDTPTISNNGTFSAPCHFLNHFVFSIAYGEVQVPFGCSACYKIWIHPRSLRALFALKGLLDGTPYSSKIKIEALNPLSSNVYLALVYGGDLPETRAAFSVLRPLIDANPQLGLEVPMEIRRGCQNYEQICGASDKYSFTPELSKIEFVLQARFIGKTPSNRTKNQRDAAAKLRMIQIAHQLGDESYQDFTGGKSLSFSAVRYSHSDNNTEV
jgi:hypothetical protein